MPTAGGPNTLGESNLVFAYDTGDTSNSYKGQPTVNVEASNIDTTFETVADGNAAGFNNQLGTGNYLGVSSTMGYKSSKSLKINRGTGGTGRIYKTYSVLTGQYSSVSCWVYSTTAGPFLALEYFGGDYSWGVGYTNNTHTGKGWELLYVRTTGPATSNTTGYYFLYTSIENQDIYLDNIQVELKQYPTTFVTGTRSATQGLLPLIGNSTIDLSNVSFDSSAKIVFDGTDDYMVTSTAIPCNFGTGDFTVEVLIYPESFASYAHMVALPNQSTFALKANISDGAIYYYDPAFSTYGSTSGWTLTLNQWNHVVLVRSGNVAYAYLNGVPKGSKTGFNTNFSSTQIVNIGNGGVTEYTQKKIDVVKIYNKALSAQEVKQNYQQYKTRFNLS